MKKRKHIGFIITILFFLTGCTNKANENLQEKINELNREINKLNVALTMHQIMEKNFESVILDPTSLEGFQRIDTDTGFFFISLRDVKPYLDGYKLTIRVGNPISATYSGFVLNVKYGKKYNISDKTVSYNDWEESLNEKESSFSKKLKPGTWNTVEFILSPAKSEELGHIELSMKTDQVILYLE
jgi:hypothetical protein